MSCYWQWCNTLSMSCCARSGHRQLASLDALCTSLLQQFLRFTTMQVGVAESTFPLAEAHLHLPVCAVGGQVCGGLLRSWLLAGCRLQPGGFSSTTMAFPSLHLAINISNDTESYVLFSTVLLVLVQCPYDSCYAPEAPRRPHRFGDRRGTATATASRPLPACWTAATLPWP